MGTTVLKAPTGKFRVVGVDTFEGPTADYLIGDYPSLDEAKQQATKLGGEMSPVYVYDSTGAMLFTAGTF